MAHMLILLLVGLSTGMVSGLFGLGGGIVLIPMLIYFFSFSQAEANGTSLVAMLLPVGALGVWQYYRSGKIGLPHLKMGLLIAVGIFAGAFLGALLATHVPDKVLRKIFASGLALMALRFFVS